MRTRLLYLYLLLDKDISLELFLDAFKDKSNEPKRIQDMKEVFEKKRKGKSIEELDDATLKELLAAEKKADGSDKWLALYTVQEFKEELNAGLETLIEKNRQEFEVMFRAYHRHLDTINTKLLNEDREKAHHQIHNEVGGSIELKNLSCSNSCLRSSANSLGVPKDLERNGNYPWTFCGANPN